MLRGNDMQQPESNAKLNKVDTTEKTSSYSNQQQPSFALEQKSWMATLLFSLLLGGIGADRFYLGYTGLGVIKLLTLGGFGFWALVDNILILTNGIKDVNGQPLADYENSKKTGWRVAATVYVLASLSAIVMAATLPGQIEAVKQEINAESRSR